MLIGTVVLPLRMLESQRMIRQWCKVMHEVPPSPMRCPVLTYPIILTLPYALSGTDLPSEVQLAERLRPCLTVDLRVCVLCEQY